MTKDSKRFLATVVTGVASIVLAVLCVKQCNDKKDAIYERDLARDVASVIEDRKEQNIALKDSLQQSRGVVDSLSNVIAARDDEVLQLRDALETTKKNLDDCANNKKKATSKKSVNRNTTSKKTVSANNQPKTIVKQNIDACQGAAQSATATSECGNAPVTVVVQNKCATSTPNANATGVTLGNGAHDNTVNINNGTINNYYGQIDTVKAAKKKVQYVVGECYTGRVVRCK